MCGRCGSAGGARSCGGLGAGGWGLLASLVVPLRRETGGLRGCAAAAVRARAHAQSGRPPAHCFVLAVRQR